MMEHRDFKGHGENPPFADWPGGARIAVSFVLNVEEGSERTVSRGDAANEPVYDMIESIDDTVNLTMESHFDYGTRAGYWRVARVLEKYGVTCTANICAEAVEISPWWGEDLVRRGFEVSSHGYRWESPLRMSEAEERAWIARSVAAIEKVCGERPVGWHCRCPHTANTRRLLMEEGGFLYDSDAYDDDLPYLVGRHVVIPYSLDTNDMRMQRPEVGFVRAKDFADYVIDAFDWLWEEGATAPKMMTIGLHPRVIGRPGRIVGLDAVLRHMTGKGAVWFARRREIAEHWLDVHGGSTSESRRK